jgi:glycosyltransferase involved in cell wall biosynthesis
MDNKKIYSLVLSDGPTSMPINDLIPELYKIKNLGYSRIVFKVSKNFSKKKNYRIRTSYGDRLNILELGLINILQLIFLIGKRKKIVKSVFLHIHNATNCYLILFSVFNSKIKIILNLHNDWKNFNTLQKIGLIIGIIFCKKLITVSDYIYGTIPSWIRKYFKIDKKHTTISNSIKYNEIRNVKKNHNIREIDVVIVGRIVPQKNWKKILEVLNKCQNLKRVEWFGSGYQESLLQKLINKNEKLRKIIFLHGVKDRKIVLETLANSKIYLSLSKWEGIGVANLEAIASGCYPVLSRIGPHDEIKNKLNLKLNNDSTDFYLAKTIDGILKNFKEFDIPNQKLQEEYSSKKMIEKYIRAISEV